MILSLIKARALVLLAVVGIIGWGIFEYNRMPVDAFPDISPIMVPVFVEGHGMAPEEIERLITYPIETAMNGLPGVTQIKSTSAFGMAVVYVYFKDNVDIYFARQLVAERLASATAELPEMEEPPTLGPISTGLGQIFIYYLTLEEGIETDGKDPNTYLREINDWVVKRQLQTVSGVTEVLSMGGHVLQYQVQINPYALKKYDLTIESIADAVRDNNRNVGGQFLVLGSEEHLVRGIGLVESLDHIKNINLKTVDGIPVKIGDVAKVVYGNEIRRGVVSLNGESEVVSGIVLKLFGENTSDVIERLYKKVDTVQKSLPKGVKLHPYYEQAELVNKATGTVKSALLQGSLLVILTLFIFLGNIRTAFIVALSLPLCALTAIIGMNATDISANLMSLGGIAIGIGMLGDGAIVMVENIYRHLRSMPNEGPLDKSEVIQRSVSEVSRPIIFSIAIIIVVFLPVFTLEGVEGKMFSPMAFTISFALLGSIVTAIIVSPILSYYLLKEGRQKEVRLMVILKSYYLPMLTWALQKKRLVMALASAAFVISLLIIPFLGTEFVPTLEEGSIQIGVAMAPSTSLEKGTETIVRLEKKIMSFKEVKEVVSRIGRPEAGSHPHPVNYAEVQIELKERDGHPDYMTKPELITVLNEELSKYPGVQLNFTQPIQNMFEELLSGVKAQLAIKVFGEDLDILRSKAGEIKEAVEDIPGLVDLSAEQSFGQPQVQVIADREACARYGVTVSEVMELVEMAVGGEVVDSIYLNTRRFGIHLRYQDKYRKDPEAIRNIMVDSEHGGSFPLSQVAKVINKLGPIQINREKNQRRWIVQGNIRGRDLGSVVADIQQRISERVKLDPGYFIEYGGQFENQQRAMGRLSIIVPIVLVTVFIILWLSFGAAKYALMIMLNVPLALIGGIFGLLISGEYLSVPASVGFIALFGIAVQNGVVLISCINQLREHEKQIHHRGMMVKLLIEAGMMRLRPVLMTALTTVLGLLPLLLSSGIGSEVQRPLAVVVVFGLTTSTLLTLFVIPVFYALVEEKSVDNVEPESVIVN
jgi:cobalt-zinc-cadmium resistance protein CzcA